MQQLTMPQSRRNWISNRISRLENDITDRNRQINILDENIDTLTTQNRAISLILDTTSHHNIAIAVGHSVFLRDFRGDNRQRLDEKLEEMREALRRQRTVHQDNRTVISNRVDRLRSERRELQGNNSRDSSEITRLRAEWRLGNLGFGFPNTPSFL